MDLFCGSKFWDNNLTWYTEDPELTPCFEKTVLTWTPCLFLWIFSVLEIYEIKISNYRNVPWNWLMILKMLLVFSIIARCFADLIFQILTIRSNDVQIHYVDVYSPLIQLYTFLLLAVLLLVLRARGRRSSGIVFLFWLISALSGLSQARSTLRFYLSHHVMQEPVFNSISFLIYYILTLLSFILNFFAEPTPTYSAYTPLERACPEGSSSFPSRLLFSWFTPIIWKGYKTPLEIKHLWNLNIEDTSGVVVKQFDKHWLTSVHKALKKDNQVRAAVQRSESLQPLWPPSLSSAGSLPKVSIVGPLWRAFWLPFVGAAFLKLISTLLVFVSPLVLKLLISFVSSHDSSWKGYLYAVLLLLLATCQTLLSTHYIYILCFVCIRVRSTLVSAIYRKALRIVNTARKDTTVGELLNLMSVDVERIDSIITFINQVWVSPLQIGVAIYFLYKTLGPSSYAGLVVMVLLIPINLWIAHINESLQNKQMKNKDERVKLTNEILSGIKVLKLYAWEPTFEQQVLSIRKKELAVLKKSAYLNSAVNFLWSCAPLMVSLASFAVFVLSDKQNILDSETAFVALALFNILQDPLILLPHLISQLVQTRVSIKRINKFMNSDEIDPSSVEHDENEPDSVMIENGSFSWESIKEECAVLKNINISVKSGSLVAVVGPVGCGKSSLLSAMLGEMVKTTGRVNTKGSVAYVTQQAWIQNATVKENILFGRINEPNNYRKVVTACSLSQDLEILPAGDLTEIGEKGINLSGGQKQRVSLARAVYSDSDIYLLDDPLSAVDSHVGKHIFDNVIGPKGILKEKTRILVTHAISFLPEVDQILVMVDGQVSESGSYKELVAQKGAFAEFIEQYMQQDTGDTQMADVPEEAHFIGSPSVKSNEFIERVARQRSRESESSSHSTRLRQRSLSAASRISLPSCELRQVSQNNIHKGEEGRLIEDERPETGNVKRLVYLHYMKYIGACLVVITILFNILFQLFSTGSNFWLSYWSSSNTNSSQVTSKSKMFIGVYAGLGFCQCVAGYFSDLLLRLGMLSANQQMHALLLHSVLFAPLSFTDTTPIGRILSRFSRDVDVLDNDLPWAFIDWFAFLFKVISTLAVISFSTPLFAAIILPIGVFYVFIQRFYVTTSRQLRRLESVSRSPLFSHFGESFTGAATIRAFGVQERFILESDEKINSNQMCQYSSYVANRWLSIRLETVGNMIIFFSALFAVMCRDSISPGFVGLSISYALMITPTLNWLVRVTSDLETNIVAVERIKEYAEVPQEAAWELSAAPPPSWPDQGQVIFDNFQVRYREGLDLVLKDVSFTVNGGEKVGIVGRTGAGKSSLTLCLFRILEAAGGRILIDGYDISHLGLYDLRSRLTIIPQDPVLFSGTLRMNLDPFNRADDETVWRVLELADLKNYVRGLPSGLQHQITEGGDNLSVGQRQLICLARALLRKTRLLILDEATAAVDLETDDLIQQTIRKQFDGCTVLTIAHRLNTVIDYDRVIVLDKGEIAEFDAPENLLKNKQSIFFGMARDANLV